MSPLDYSATQLLATAEPEVLFTTPDITVVHKEFLKLAAKWHPDICKDPKASDVLAHLNVLKQRAEEKLAKGFWQAPNLLTLKLNDGKHKPNLQVKYKKHHSFELGDFYICDNSVVYLLKTGSDDLVRGFLKSIENFKFASDRMKDEISRYLPQLGSIHHSIAALEATDGRKILVVKKNPDQILLRDLLTVGSLDPRHVAWIISSLLNLACYLEYNQQTLNDISLDTVYIAPEHHSVALLGGWWYSVARGERLVAVPKRTLNLLPPKVLTTKKASRRTDLELIRAIFRELVGDKIGIGTLAGIPESMVEWGRFPSSGSAKDDYKYWMEVLKKAFGKRTFTKLNVTAEQIYKEL
jgi:hypothetical protein